MSSSSNNRSNNSSPDSYDQILKSSSIIGGAKVVNYACSMLRGKVVAMLLGPSGVGIIGLYLSATSMIGVISSLGIATSGGREIARNHANGDSNATARTIKVLRRSCWVTGMIGWLLTVILSWPLSLWIFGSSERAWAIAILGITILFKDVSDGQSSLLGGMRRIGDLAKIDITSVVLSTFVALGMYAWLKEDGIVPVIVATAAINLFSSWYHCKKIVVQNIDITWSETYRHAKGFVALGTAFVWSAVIGSVTSIIIRSQIVQHIGLDANGIFQAASGLSIIFAGFILGAMAADFYPRLSAVADDDKKLNQLVNEQTEIGILLVLPGLMATLAYSPWIMRLFYSEQFVSGAPLLSWMIISVLGRIISWPLGYALLAKSEPRLFAITETLYAFLHLGMAIILLKYAGILGVSISYALLYILHTIGMFYMFKRLTGLRYTNSVMRLLIISCLFVASGFVIGQVSDFPSHEVFGSLLTAASIIYCVRGLAIRLGPENKIVKIISRLPFGRMLCGTRNT